MSCCVLVSGRTCHMFAQIQHPLLAPYPRRTHTHSHTHTQGSRACWMASPLLSWRRWLENTGTIQLGFSRLSERKKGGLLFFFTNSVCVLLSVSLSQRSSAGVRSPFRAANWPTPAVDARTASLAANGKMGQNNINNPKTSSNAYYFIY